MGVQINFHAQDWESKDAAIKARGRTVLHLLLGAAHNHPRSCPHAKLFFLSRTMAVSELRSLCHDRARSAGL